MKYAYTWNHILLLANICCYVDDEDSVTASWVKITEEHNRQTFPFTLWPLTYRTCEVTTSPAMCSPNHVKTNDGISVKMYKCNEIMIICIQDHYQDSSRNNICNHPCVADIDTDDDQSEETNETSSTETPDNHVDHHSNSKDHPLLPCHVAHRYKRMKTSVDNLFFDTQANVECVLCIGHGEAAALASCLASEMSLAFEDERKFLGLETKRVCVDFVGFSDAVVASKVYWDKSAPCIDKYISVVFEESSAVADKTFIANPRSLRVTIRLPTTSLTRAVSIRSVSGVLNKLRQTGKRDKHTLKSKICARHIADYISAINKNIYLQINPGS